MCSSFLTYPVGTVLGCVVPYVPCGHSSRLCRSLRTLWAQFSAVSFLTYPVGTVLGCVVPYVPCGHSSQLCRSLSCAAGPLIGTMPITSYLRVRNPILREMMAELIGTFILVVSSFVSVCVLHFSLAFSFPLLQSWRVGVGVGGRCGDGII